MIKLPNGCYCSEPAISPKNWKTLTRITGPWRLTYRFYEPGREKPFQVNSKALNEIADIKERIAAGKFNLKEERALLLNGYNPRLKKTIRTTGVADQDTFFVDALYAVLDRIEIDKDMKKELRNYIIANVHKAATSLNYQGLSIGEVKRRHLIFILDRIRETSPRFTDNTFNHYRSYLKIPFDELMELQVIEDNPATSIRKKAHAPKEREVLTDEQRLYVDHLLSTKHQSFHRFLHIFFHSGGRIKELLRLKGEDIDLQGQRYKTEVRKGRKAPRTAWRTIPDIALDYWKEATKGCAPDQFVFSEGLTPGVRPILASQITKRWTRIIKKRQVMVNKKRTWVDREHIINGQPVKITADFYSLKHLHTTDVVTSAGERTAAEINAHTSTAMVVKIYDVKQQERQHEKNKKINIPFAK